MKFTFFLTLSLAAVLRSIGAVGACARPGLGAPESKLIRCELLETSREGLRSELECVPRREWELLFKGLEPRVRSRR